MISVALITWPIVMIAMARSLPWQNVVVASLIGGYLLLPERGGLDLPLLPPFEKDTIPGLVLFFLALILRPMDAKGPNNGVGATTLKGWRPKSKTGTILLLMLVLVGPLTALTNADPIRFAETRTLIPGLTLYDGFSFIVRSIAVVLPIVLGRKFLADSQGHRILLIGLVICGLCYSLLALYEIRFSPQMNRMVYGFFPHDWAQHIRAGGFRPLVFLPHGLLLAIFFAMTILAAIGLFRAEPKNRTRWVLAAGWLFVTLLLSNSLGGLIIAAALIPIVFFLTVSMQLLLAGIIAGVVLAYPVLRGADLVPTDGIVSAVQSFDETRALSLQFRINNEDALLDRANERPLFGWGPYGRNRVYDEFGRDLSVVDGAWIGVIGQGGWLRYIAEFGLLSVPLMLFALRRQKYNVDQFTATLCLILAANMIDMIPNSGRSPITWLIVGALLGRLELGRTRQDKPGTDPDDDSSNMAPVDVSPYTRQTNRHTRKQLVKKY